jgi:hypothetical protein
MAKTLGIGMIEMYTKMIKTEFEPLISNLEARRTVEKANTEVDVRKELGIYNLTVKKFKLQAELDEIKRQLKTYEDTNYQQGKYVSKIDEVVSAKMAERKNGLLAKTEKIRNDLIKRVKLAGVNADIKEVFEDLPALLEPLEKEIKKLPKVKPLKKIGPK